VRRRLNLRLLIWTVVVIAVGAGIVHAVHLVQIDRNARSLLEYARTEKRPEVALERYAQYLKFRKDDLDATEEYALALDAAAVNESDNHLEVVRLIEPLLVRSGDRPKARTVLVDNLIYIGRWDAAVTHLDVLLAELPEGDAKTRADLEHKRGWCLDALGKCEAGADAYRKSIAADPSRVVAYVLLAEILDYRLARDKEGLDVLDEAIAKNPKSSAALLARFAHRRVFGTKEDAAADLDAAIKLDGKNPDVLLAASRWAQAQGDFEKARALVAEGILQNDADERLLKESAELELRAGHADKALELATRGLKNVGKETQTIELQLFRADLLIDAGKIAEAEEEVRGMRTRTSISMGADSRPEFLRARLLVAAKDYRQAADVLEKIRPRLEQDPYWNTRINSLLGLCYAELGDLERRIQALSRALRTDPSWPPLMTSLAQAYLESGQPAKALELVDGVNSPDAKVLAARAQLLVTLAEPERERDWQRVDDAFRAATTGEAESLDRILLRAEIARARGNGGEAEQILLAEMKRRLPNPKADSGPLWLALAELVAARRDPEWSLKVLADARKRFGDSAAIRTMTIRILASRAKPTDIALLGHVADDLDTFSPEERGRILRELADAWIRLGDPGAADAVLARAAAEQPRDLRSRSVQFDLALERGQPKEARRLLDEMRKLEDPKGLVVPIAEAMLQAENADAAALQRLLKQVESGPLRKRPARQALVKAVLHERLHDNRAVIDDLQTALDGGFRSAPLTARLVQLLVEDRRLVEASSALTMLERAGPLPNDLWHSAVDIAVALHDVPRVRELLSPKYLDETRDYRELIWLSRAYAGIDESATALKCLNRAIDLAPHAPEPWTAAIRYLVRRNQRPEAVALAEQVKTKAPARYRSFLAGRCAESLGDHKAAESAYRKALEERPKDALQRLAVADFYASIEQPKEAAEQFRIVIDAASASAPEVVARARRGLAALYARSDPAEARKILEPNLGRGDLADRRLTWFLDGFDPAKRPEAIRQYAASGKMSAEERFRLVQLYDLAGDVDGSSRNRERILAEQAETPEMLAYWVRELVTHGQTDVADPLLERLRQMEPNAPRTAELVKLRASAGAKA
jgi:cellulose synthase operon protein C